jgi:hypothetical protein
VGVLEDYQDRVLARQGFHLKRQRLKRFLPALRGERGVATITRERKHLGEQCGMFDRRRSQREHGIKFFELRLRRIIVLYSGGAFHLADDRMEGAVGVLWRAEITQSSVWLARKALNCMAICLLSCGVATSCGASIILRETTASSSFPRPWVGP